jgi:hypothetical protein
MRLLAVLFICVMVAYAADRCSPPLELAEFVNTLPADRYSPHVAPRARKSGIGKSSCNQFIADITVGQGPRRIPSCPTSCS